MANLSIRRGQTYDEPVTLGIDLTGATVYFTVKSAYDDVALDTSAIIKKDITSHDDAVGGVSRLTLTSEETNVTPGKYTFDFHVKLADNTVVAYDPATLTIKPSVTLRS